MSKQHDMSDQLPLSTQLITERPDGSLRVQTVNTEPSMTKQSFKDECDIHHIINRYDNTGLVEHLNKTPGTYGDVTQVPDYHTAMNIVSAVNSQFLELPAKVRAAFNNDPSEFLDAVNDPTQVERLAGLGITSVFDTPDSGPAPIPSGDSEEGGPRAPDPAPGGAGSEESTPEGV